MRHPRRSGGVRPAARQADPDWRQLTKLRSTYTDALPELINPETGRVHTSYAMAVDVDGPALLVRSEPPEHPGAHRGRPPDPHGLRRPAGHQARRADYSQIELRVLAHIADIPQLQAGLRRRPRHPRHDRDRDVRRAGRRAWTREVRRRAKAINFGIIYGISAFGLANQLAIPREEAGDYIKTYFERFPGIRDYMDGTKSTCRENGYVETIFGRRCHFPRIKSTNPVRARLLERAAINAPIQGTAADIIRRAMIRMQAALAAAGLPARCCCRSTTN